MFQLCRYLQRDRTPGDVGIEIECEFKGRYPSSLFTPSGWQMKTDGSLRFEGREFVTRGPILLAAVEERVRTVIEVIKKPDFDLLLNSYRCGVHVHVNVCEFNLLEYYTATTAYWLLENLLMHFCGEEKRVGNLYCMRLSDVEDQLGFIIDDMKNRHPLLSGNLESNRYTSQNLGATRKFCSIEYRGMRAGDYDPEIISIWAKSLYHLTRNAKAIASNPEKFFLWYENQLHDGNHDLVLNELLGSENPIISKLKEIPSYQLLMEENLDLLDTFAFALDWDRWYTKFLERQGEGSTNDQPPLDANPYPDEDEDEDLD